MALTLLPRRRSAWTDADHLTAILGGLPVIALACDLDGAIVFATPRAVDAWAAMVPGGHLVGVDVDRILGVPDLMGRVRDSTVADPYQVDVVVGGRRMTVDISAMRREGQLVGAVAVAHPARAQSSTAHLAGAASEVGHSTTDVAEAVARVDGVRSTVAGHSDALSTGMAELLDLMNSVADGAAMIRESTLAVVDSAHQAGGNVSELAEASGTIGEFTATISSIAEQTKLLALNATIEATRAGAAGSGFAVVAQEVKNLAQRSAIAAEKISAIVDSIQRSSRTAGAALATINEKVDIVGGQQLSVNVIVDNQVKKVEEIVGITRDLADSVADLDGAVAGTSHCTETLVGRVQALTGAITSLPAAD